MTREEGLKALDGFLLLEENWDSYGAVPISKKAIGVARSIVSNKETEPAPWVVPSCNGGVSLEWFVPEFTWVCVEPDGSVEVFVSRRGDGDILTDKSLHFVISAVV